jgi:tyrosinase
MRAVAISPNDPLFWLHHAFVDKVWDLWQQRHSAEPFRGHQPSLPGTARAGHNLFDRMAPFGVPAFDALTTEQLGYRYQSDDFLDRQFSIAPNPPVTKPAK